MIISVSVMEVNCQKASKQITFEVLGQNLKLESTLLYSALQFIVHVASVVCGALPCAWRSSQLIYHFFILKVKWLCGAVRAI